MTKLSSRFLTILAAVAVPVALVMAPSVALAKKPKRFKINLEGPINHAKDPGFTPGTHLCCFPSYTPTIQIKAKFKRKKPNLVVVTQYGLWGPCSGYESSDGLSKHEFNGKLKRNGTFLGTDTQYGSDTLTVSGRILPGKGTASGTVREVENRPFKEGSGTAWGTCDSGTVSWTASRVKELSEVKSSFDPTLVWPGL